MAAVFARKSDFLFEPNNQTTIGIWLSADPVQLIPRAASQEELGAAARAALAASRRGVPLDPASGRGFPSSLLRVAGVRSWNALQRTAARCQLEGGGSTIRIVPCRNGGTKGDDSGYHSLDELAVAGPAAATDAELGAALLSALGTLPVIRNFPVALRVGPLSHDRLRSGHDLVAWAKPDQSDSGCRGHCLVGHDHVDGIFTQRIFFWSAARDVSDLLELRGDTALHIRRLKDRIKRLANDPEYRERFKRPLEFPLERYW